MTFIDSSFFKKYLLPGFIFQSVLIAGGYATKPTRREKFFLSHTDLRGKYVLRMAIGARMTDERHVREAWELMQEKSSELLK